MAGLGVLLGVSAAGLSVVTALVWTSAMLAALILLLTPMVAFKAEHTCDPIECGCAYLGLRVAPR